MRRYKVEYTIRKYGIAWIWVKDGDEDNIEGKIIDNWQEHEDELDSPEGMLLEIGATADEPMLSASEADPSRAKLVAIINKSSIGSSAQTMKVYFEGKLVYEWLVSTGREKLEQAKSGRVYRTTTPIGYYRPTTIELNHFSQTLIS